MAEACMRHGYCTAELLTWYIVKQLILPPDVNEVTDPDSTEDSTLDFRSGFQVARGNAAQIEFVR